MIKTNQRVLFYVLLKFCKNTVEYWIDLENCAQLENN